MLERLDAFDPVDIIKSLFDQKNNVNKNDIEQKNSFNEKLDEHVNRYSEVREIKEKKDIHHTPRQSSPHAHKKVNTERTANEPKNGESSNIENNIHVAIETEHNEKMDASDSTNSNNENIILTSISIINDIPNITNSTDTIMKTSNNLEMSIIHSDLTNNQNNILPTLIDFNHTDINEPIGSTSPIENTLLIDNETNFNTKLVFQNIQDQEIPETNTKELIRDIDNITSTLATETINPEENIMPNENNNTKNIEGPINLSNNAFSSLLVDPDKNKTDTKEEITSELDKVENQIKNINQEKQITNEKTVVTKNDLLNSDKLTAAFGQKLMMMINQKQQTATVRLDPPELGEIEVKIQFALDKANVSFTTINQGVKEAIEGSLDKLRELLVNNQLNLGDVSVFQDNKGDNKNSKEYDTSIYLTNNNINIEETVNIPQTLKGNMNRLDIYV